MTITRCPDLTVRTTGLRRRDGRPAPSLIPSKHLPKTVSNSCKNEAGRPNRARRLTSRRPGATRITVPGRACRVKRGRGGTRATPFSGLRQPFLGAALLPYNAAHTCMFSGRGVKKVEKQMRRRILVSMLIACAGVLAFSTAAALASPETKPDVASPRVFLLDGDHLSAAREKLRGGDKSLQPALEKLRADAQSAMRRGRFRSPRSDGRRRVGISMIT